MFYLSPWSPCKWRLTPLVAIFHSPLKVAAFLPSLCQFNGPRKCLPSGLWSPVWTYSIAGVTSWLCLWGLGMWTFPCMKQQVKMTLPCSSTRETSCFSNCAPSIPGSSPWYLKGSVEDRGDPSSSYLFLCVYLYMSKVLTLFWHLFIGHYIFCR